jgi:hypothetical protein
MAEAHLQVNPHQAGTLPEALGPHWPSVSWQRGTTSQIRGGSCGRGRAVQARWCLRVFQEVDPGHLQHPQPATALPRWHLDSKVIPSSAIPSACSRYQHDSRHLSYLSLLDTSLPLSPFISSTSHLFGRLCISFGYLTSFLLPAVQITILST